MNLTLPTSFFKKLAAAQPLSPARALNPLSFVMPVFLQQGIKASQHCLDCLPPNAKEVSATILYSSAAGALLGASIGATISAGNPIATSSGTVIGGALGFTSGIISVSKTQS